MMTFIEEYDADLGHTFTIPELEFEEGEEMDAFTIRQRPAISRAIAVAIENLVSLEIEKVPAFAIKDINLVFNLNRGDAVYSVDQCIEYFKEEEEYEKCARLLNLKSKL
jgi:hypothetical protein